MKLKGACSDADERDLMTAASALMGAWDRERRAKACHVVLSLNITMTGGPAVCCIFLEDRKQVNKL